MEHSDKSGMPARAKSYPVKLKLVKLDDRSFHIVTEGSLNGIPVNLVIDTGASRSVFSREHLKGHLRAGGSLDQEEIQTAGISSGKINISLAIADTFVIGKFRKTDYPVMLIKLGKINKIYHKATGFPIHGLIGSDFLQEMNAIIDYKKLIMSLRPPDGYEAS